MVTNSRLHLIRPLGFDVDDKTLKRAGLDYWNQLDWVVHDSYDDYARLPGRRWFLSTRGGKRHSEAAFQDGDHLVFGKETAGLPKPLLDANAEQVLRIPMRAAARSMNLSNAVAVTLYEALRQLDYRPICD